MIQPLMVNIHVQHDGDTVFIIRTCLLLPPVSRPKLTRTETFKVLSDNHLLFALCRSHSLSPCPSSPAIFPISQAPSLPSIHQMPSDIPYFPHHLPAPPIYSPVPTPHLLCNHLAFPAHLVTCISFPHQLSPYTGPVPLIPGQTIKAAMSFKLFWNPNLTLTLSLYLDLYCTCLPISLCTTPHMK